MDSKSQSSEKCQVSNSKTRPKFMFQMLRQKKISCYGSKAQKNFILWILKHSQAKIHVSNSKVEKNFMVWILKDRKILESYIHEKLVIYIPNHCKINAIRCKQIFAHAQQPRHFLGFQYKPNRICHCTCKVK